MSIANAAKQKEPQGSFCYYARAAWYGLVKIIAMLTPLIKIHLNLIDSGFVYTLFIQTSFIHALRVGHTSLFIPLLVQKRTVFSLVRQ